MEQYFDKKFMVDHRGCYSLMELLDCSFMAKDPISLSDILHSEIPLKDKYWFICTQVATKEENQQVAIRVAEIVLPIYEKRYPGNKAPHEAIKAAKAYLAGRISLKELVVKRTAAYAIFHPAAYAAAYAADAASYAASYAAAYAAAYAADAASAAIKQKLQTCLFGFISSKKPKSENQQ